MTKSRNILPPRRYWSAAELDLLRSMYPECHTDDVASWLGRCTKACYAAAKVHGLRKSAAYLASDTARRIQRGHQNPNMIASQFKPGLVPWNTGVKGVTGVQEACRRTQFKKGDRCGAAARNYVPIGSHRVSADGCLERKVTDDPRLYPARRWVPVARIVWEAANGPIPRAHVIVYKPGQRTAVLEEITVDRLECIDRAELARRNHPRNHSPELARLVQLKGAITRQVNRIAREAEQRTQA
jgi:hypothetical protein